MTTKRFGLTLLTGLIFLASPVFGADFSSPQKTVVSFLTALRTGDEKTLQSALYIADDQKDAVAPMLALLNATTRMQLAAQKKFGSEGEKEFGASTQAQVERHLKAVESANEKITGDDAVIEIPRDAETKLGGGTVKLKKVGDSWLINTTDMFKLDKLTNEKIRTRQLLFASRMAALTESITKEINDGKFATAKDALKNFWERSKSVQDALNKESAATTTTAPASQPTK